MWSTKTWLLSLLSLTGRSTALAYDAEIHMPNLRARQAYALAGHAPNASDSPLGNAYNYWKKLPNGTIDLTRSLVLPVTAPKLITFNGSRDSAIIEPSRSILCIVDMQNFFLHPAMSPWATAGRNASVPTIKMINAFRAHGMKVAWVNWGLTAYDTLTMPPSILAGFSTNFSDRADQTFGSDMGNIKIEDGSTIAAGPLLMRGAWNAEPWGELGKLKDEGLKSGTDVHFWKNRESGLWGAQTPFGMWLQENEITTIFFGGVNADQCVWSTLMDAYFKGYDTIYVDDIAATSSPDYATQMVLYNADYNGFIGNSTGIIKSLG